MNPIFIIGNPRSGTSLLRIILNSHKEIMIPPEAGFAMWLYSKYKNQDFSISEIKLNYLQDLYQTRKFETWGLNPQELKKYILSKNISRYSEMIRLIYIFYGKSKNRSFSRWGDKNNFYIDYITQINQLFKNVQFIHIVRDGRDIVCSYKDINKKRIKSKYKPNLPDDVKSIAYEWKENEKKISDSFESVDDNRTLTIRYEDLILNFSKTMKNIMKYLNLPYDDGMEHYYLNNNDEPTDFLQWKSKIKKPIDKSRVCRYKIELDDNSVKIFNNIASSVLKKYNYELN